MPTTTGTKVRLRASVSLGLDSRGKDPVEVVFRFEMAEPNVLDVVPERRCSNQGRHLLLDGRFARTEELGHESESGRIHLQIVP